MTLFIKEALEGENVITESITDAIADTMDAFVTYAERKLKGYSYGEIDRLAKAAKDVDSEEKKRKSLNKIEDALKDARIDLQKTKDREAARELRLQIQVLGELKAKVNAFKVADDHNTEHGDKINLDER